MDLLEEIGAQPLAEYGAHAKGFHLVVLRRAGAVGVDVVDIGRCQPGIGDGVAHRADDGAAVRVGAGTVEGIGTLPAAEHKAQDLRPACAGRALILQHQRCRTLAHHEAVAGFLERPGRALRLLVAGGEGREEREADQRLRLHRSVGADGQRRPRLAALDRLYPQLDGGGTGGTSGRQAGSTRRGCRSGRPASRRCRRSRSGRGCRGGRGQQG